MTDQIVCLGQTFYHVLRSGRGWAVGSDFAGISDVTVFNQTLVVLCRKQPELLVLSLSGQHLRTVSLTNVILGHGIRTLGPDMLAVTDVDGHQVLLLDKDFNEIHRLHCNNRPALGRPFNHPADCAKDSEGRFWITDGYGNSQVHVFSANYEFSHSIGGAGVENGEFTTPHAVALLANGNIAIADRENNRMQVLDADGTQQFNILGLHKPMGLEVDGTTLYVTDQTPRLSAYDLQGKLIGRCRTFATYGHGVTCDHLGNIYIADMLPDGLTKLQPVEDT
ncbi:hypothetical protein GGR95_003504 [Sulfitobacter undariae]|uniref:NHL repeat-containing protein n=1 Tax=Sulfitobacter undariae TaxID=1563671 RepID=A0A7W6H1S0_9RHOB|nr:peptidylglycine monooxygenase [Sulfitobacter undariae]MBB3995840.1 hypothetical protein [Sulfitobacter undariae]